jgi:hypothetical protein
MLAFRVFSRVSCLTGILALAVTAPLAARSGPALPTGEAVGDQDIGAFYRWNGELPSAPGRILRQERLPARLVPSHAGAAYRILYSSTDGRWNSGILPVSGALFLPRGPAPRGGWNLVVWAHGTLGMSDVCAPSWAGMNERDRHYVDRWLEQGYAVVAPDYQGLGGPGPHPYSLPMIEGLSVLDAARAALRLDRRIANRVIITGQSQGSGATLGAARLAGSYAPELDVRGVIATALISSFPQTTQVGNRMPGDGAPYYLVYRMLGGSLPDSAPPLVQLLTEKGQILLGAARSQCTPRVVSQQYDITGDNAFTVPVARIEEQMGPVGAFDAAFSTPFPMMLGTGLADELISAERQGLAVSALCRAGNRVVWRRYPDARHSDTLTRSFDDAEQFARQVFTGTRVVSEGCDLAG